jgi:hypothetical protein
MAGLWVTLYRLFGVGAEMVKPAFVSLLHRTVSVGPGEWHAQRFQVQGTWLKPRLWGWLRASGGVELFVIPEQEHAHWHSAHCHCHQSVLTSEGTFNVPLTAGAYYLIVSNRSDGAAGRDVEAQFRLVFGAINVGARSLRSFLADYLRPPKPEMRVSEFDDFFSEMGIRPEAAMIAGILIVIAALLLKLTA